jgi:hypothetical protein
MISANRVVIVAPLVELLANVARAAVDILNRIVPIDTKVVCGGNAELAGANIARFRNGVRAPTALVLDQRHEEWAGRLFAFAASIAACCRSCCVGIRTPPWL